MTDDGRDADLFYPARASQPGSLDEEARRRVADRVRDVVKSGATRIARRDAALLAGHMSVPSAPTGREVATAASAVVLASDLRAAEDLADAVRAGILAVEGQEPPDGHLAFGVSPNRQGWRARLANVERLLSEGMEDAGTSSLPYHRMRDALAEVRSMIDGEGE